MSLWSAGANWKLYNKPTTLKTPIFLLMTKETTTRKPYATIIALVVVAAYYLTNDDSVSNPPSGLAESQRTEFIIDPRADGKIVESVGIVERLLPDDNEGSRHQRFILKMDSGQTLLIAHNIDLALRINGLQRGDEVKFRGQYELNDRGGVVHWTHDDPRGNHPAGWLEHNGKRYQ